MTCASSTKRRKSACVRVRVRVRLRVRLRIRLRVRLRVRVRDPRTRATAAPRMPCGTLARH